MWVCVSGGGLNRPHCWGIRHKHLPQGLLDSNFWKLLPHLLADPYWESNAPSLFLWGLALPCIAGPSSAWKLQSRLPSLLSGADWGTVHFTLRSWSSVQLLGLLSPWLISQDFSTQNKSVNSVYPHNYPMKYILLLSQFTDEETVKRARIHT